MSLTDVNEKNKIEVFVLMSKYLYYLLDEKFSIYSTFFYPTVSEIKKDIKEPCYTRCFPMTNGDAIGYKGYISDIVDFNTSHHPFPGINLWILTYDLDHGFKFLFIQVESEYEIGTKHCNMLYKLRNDNAYIIMAGEVYYMTENVSSPSMIWNFSSGTITTRIYGQDFLYKMLCFLLDKPILEIPDKLKQLQFLRNMTSELSKVVGYDIKILKFVNLFINTYAPIIFENYIAYALIKTVLPLMSNIQINHLFQFIDLEKPDMQSSLPNLLNKIDNIKSPIETYADYVCLTKPHTRENLYIFPNKGTCSENIYNDEKDLKKYCFKK